MRHLVFVCWGNICRSPMAERVARRRIEEQGLGITVESFGLSNENFRDPIDHRAIRVLDGAGYVSDGHGARQVAAEHLNRADLVVAVEPYQVERLLEIAPEANVVLLNDFNPALEPGTPLIDPWYGHDDGFNDTLADIEAAMPAILEEVMQ